MAYLENEIGRRPLLPPVRSTFRRNRGPKSTPVDNFSTGAAAPRWPCTTSRQRRAGPAPPLLQRRAPTCRAACRFTHVPRDDSRRSHVAHPVGRLDQGRTFCLTRQPEMRFLSNRYPKLTESTSFNGNDDRNRHSIRIATQHGRCDMAAFRQNWKEARGGLTGQSYRAPCACEAPAVP